MLVPGFDGEITIPGGDAVCKEPFNGNTCSDIKDCTACPSGCTSNVCTCRPD